jgi:putative ABC transport system ATP-binding protein
MFEFRSVKYKDVVDIPDLYIEEGLTVLLGASGSGKTTVLRMLNKMISPTEGEILFHGTGMKQIPSVKHRRKVLMLSQNPAMFEGNIRDNLTIACRFQEKDMPVDEDLREILPKVRLNKDLDTPVNYLSGGEKQRLALGRVLLLDPEVYLLDEPSSALDDDTEDTIVEMLSDLVKSTGKSIVMVTHSKAVAEKYADTLIEMSDGKIINRRKK